MNLRTLFGVLFVLLCSPLCFAANTIPEALDYFSNNKLVVLRLRSTQGVPSVLVELPEANHFQVSSGEVHFKKGKWGKTILASFWLGPLLEEEFITASVIFERLTQVFPVEWRNLQLGPDQISVTLGAFEEMEELRRTRRTPTEEEMEADFQRSRLE